MLFFQPWSQSEAADSKQEKFFESQVRPLLVKNCFSCHSAEKQKGNLRLDSRGAILLGGDSGPAVVPGKPDDSLLIHAVRYESYEMPPSRRLSDADVIILSEWILNGAYWPGDDGKVARRQSHEFTDEDRSWWAFQPISTPSIPRIDDADWAKTEIDFFIAKERQKHGLTPVPQADRGTLIRRLYFDVIGLPPTPEEVREFVQDENPSAYEDLVNQLLDRPEYAERWGRHWLDLVRYADGDGYKADHYRPQAWRYRDYVIESLNADKPYDRFVQEQIAGDELFPGDPQALIATGFLRHGIYEYNSRDVRTQWDLMQNEITDVTADVFLGLGLQCAKCHDHKFDPLLQQDYYRLRAFFESVLPRDDLPAATPEELDRHQQAMSEYASRTKDLQEELHRLEEKYRKAGENLAVGRFPDDIQELIRKPKSEQTPEEQQLVALAWRQVVYENARIDGRMGGQDKERILELRRELAKFSPPESLPTPMVTTDVGCTAPGTTIPKKGIAVEPGFPTILDPDPATISGIGLPNSTGRRAALARWLTSPENPLTARVIVNRIWQYHFGKGLAENSSDFGRLGVPPSHPELLDWLASRLIDEGWRMKSLHRLILNSATYRQSSRHPLFDDHNSSDPLNQYYWRFGARRLDAEQIRDSILSVTHRLDTRKGGPGSTPEQHRRSIYTRVMRNSRDPLLDAFDLPEFFVSTASRDTTTSPVQSLLLLNSQTMQQHARALADRIRETTVQGAGLQEQVGQLWQLTLGRSPGPEELECALAFLEPPVTQESSSESTPPVNGLSTGKLPYRDGQAVVFHGEHAADWLAVAHRPEMTSEEFTIEAFFQLDSIADSSALRTIVSKSDGNHSEPGWIFGVTGKGSRRKPQTLVLQLFGRSSTGSLVEAALFSDQHVDINKPFFAAVSLQLAKENHPGIARFYLKDLSNDDEPLLVAEIPHRIVGGIENGKPLMIGCQKPTRHHFDGMIDEVRLSEGVLAQNQLLYSAERATTTTIGYWRFEPVPGILQDSSQNGFNIDPPTHNSSPSEGASSAAFVNLCHVLLNCNEFLYVD
ncbi:DUF1553 domain-containing protein [Planctomicrobium sp. SH661]|uniref:DUF1553 domain-containing protein n=1 Tax=Planctomicrobium sp. SH661 TaxID=3448124 RepID=UPI003F5B4DF2